ncbi:MAG: SDR family NAD(P)-dependent oxidoreductase [Terriglobia bacterium]
MLTRNLAVELVHWGLTSIISPREPLKLPLIPLLLNNLKKLNSLLHRIPLGYIAKPKDVAGVAVFLADEANYVTGSTYFVDGAVSLFWRR